MDSFILYGEWERHFALLPPEQRGELISLIFAYANRGEIPETTVELGIAIAFSFIKTAMDDNEEKYKKKQALREEAGRVGGKAKASKRKDQDVCYEDASKSDFASVCLKNPSKAALNGSVSGSVSESLPPDGGGKARAARPRIPPTLEEVSAYVAERQSIVDPQGFIDFYASKGWMVGKTPMKDWKAACRNAEDWDRWKQRDRQEGSHGESTKHAAKHYGATSGASADEAWGIRWTVTAGEARGQLEAALTALRDAPITVDVGTIVDTQAIQDAVSKVESEARENLRQAKEREQKTKAKLDELKQALAAQKEEHKRALAKAAEEAAQKSDGNAQRLRALEQELALANPDAQTLSRASSAPMTLPCWRRSESGMRLGAQARARRFGVGSVGMCSVSGCEGRVLIMLEIVLRVDVPAGQAIGIKEAIAVDLEQYGDVRVISVRELEAEQLRFG